MKPQEAIDFLKDRFDGHWKPEFELYGWTLSVHLIDDDTPTWYDVMTGSETVWFKLQPRDAVKTPRELDQLLFRACLNAVIEARDDCLRDGEFEDAEPYEETLHAVGDAAYWQMTGTDNSERGRDDV